MNFSEPPWGNVQLTSLAWHHKVMRRPLAPRHTLSMSVLGVITLCSVASEVKLNRKKNRIQIFLLSNTIFHLTWKIFFQMCILPQSDCSWREIQFLTDFVNQYFRGRPERYWDSKVERETDFDNTQVVGRLFILEIMKGHIKSNTLILPMLPHCVDYRCILLMGSSGHTKDLTAYLLLCVSTTVPARSKTWHADN